MGIDMHPCGTLALTPKILRIFQSHFKTLILDCFKVKLSHKLPVYYKDMFKMKSTLTAVAVAEKRVVLIATQEAMDVTTAIVNTANEGNHVTVKY